VCITFLSITYKKYMSNQKTKQQKREEILQKKKIKQKKGGTLAGQISRAQTAKNYEKSKRK